MSFNSVIFSERRADRIRRHVIFWVTWGFYFGLLHAANPFLKPEGSYFRRSQFAFAETFLQLIPQIIVAYIILFLVLPQYTKRKRIVSTILLAFVAWFACGSLNLFMIQKLNPVILAWILPDHLLVNTQRPPQVSQYMALLSTWKGALSGTAFFFGLHFIKQWFVKEQRNLQLQKEKTEAQMKLLTAQIHPHFLFNTLNNIYSQTQTESPKGSKMIMGLSDMLRYILYEGAKPLVPLKQEVNMIREYINLEKIRYGNDLEVHVRTPSEVEDLYIAPLLLLPFVENCFKHGTSKMLQSPWINLTIELNESRLIMKLLNGKTSKGKITGASSGIGIQNVKQRLQLLYEGKHLLQITEDEEVFIVDLEVELTRSFVKSNVQAPLPPTLQHA